MKSEVASLLIITKLEQYDYAGATALAVAMLVASFAMLFAINALQWHWQRRTSRNGRSRGRARSVSAALHSAPAAGQGAIG
jgi:sulfate transport system permease protein